MIIRVTIGDTGFESDYDQGLREGKISDYVGLKEFLEGIVDIALFNYSVSEGDL